ncbi:MAG: hypothetical protein B7Y31_01675 [Novosphingobium sp. 16-62-11]|uniref:hypothetical protein n=1 Tax=Novosphingobium sp. 17-62-19 TaxID=1970406 RepID=UPI000BD3CD25|nr:hypothetical protein [Novosphingobium sp. 17-62-19]OYZ45506.1 MAG: hypothetical protein B7Y31_01675 [Novosphingobium sp. 16-62-11]OZA17041.1 MAG: hypothetical protein B7X90_16315 [Novosphingobium sp. 17-62-19]OZA72777.1 MAG: hypothetical protein B7X78_00285 [Sphingomonadales bacterium 39-62-4]HQS97555.1 hypothetical protein [Novosphingobium sp.]
MSDGFDAVFTELRAILLEQAGGMVVTLNAPGHLVMKTPWNEPGKTEPAWFGMVQVKKAYVSCHLMPLYALPALLEGTSPELRKRMQGKSCFNFKKAEADLFTELATLTRRCAEAYAEPVGVT